MSEVYAVKVQTRNEAEEVLDCLRDLTDQYGEVSVADLHDLVGIESVFADTRFGWRANELRSATIRCIPAGYNILFPQAVNLKSTPSIPSALSMTNIGRPVTITSWRLDERRNPIGDPNTYAGILEGFWNTEEKLVVKLQGFDSFNYLKKLFHVEAYVK